MIQPSRRPAPPFRIARTAALVAGLQLCACASGAPPMAPDARTAAADPAGVTVYVVYNHFHAGLTVPTPALAARPGPTAQALSVLTPKRWTSLGYGDAKFYEHQGINPGRALDFFRSMLAPGNASVVHLGEVDDPLHDASRPRILRLTLAPQRFDDLVRRVDASFALQPGGKSGGSAPRFEQAGQDGDDAFFKGARPASAIHECNQWLGEVLGAAGVPHSPLLDTTSDGLGADLLASGHAVRVADQAAGPS